MNEAAQVLNQTNHERKAAGYGVHHKKGGSAVTKLGNKPMSWQEIQKRHGECKEFDLGGFMDYETFKKMDPDLEAEYVNKLCSKHHIRHEQVSKWLFELGENDLMARLKIKGVDKKIVKIKASDVTNDAIKDFHDLVEIWRQREAAAKIIDLSEAQRKHDMIENGEFISYEEFSGFSIDEKVSYLNSLINKYGVSFATIERELFKLKPTYLRHQLYTAGVLKNIKHGATGYAAQAINAAFCEALKTWRGENAMVVNEPINEESEETAVEEPKESLKTVEQPDIPTEETLDKQIKDLNRKLASDPVVSVDDFLKQGGIPKLNQINLEFTPLKVEETPKPSSEVYFSTRYVSEKGLDREAIMNKIYLLATLFENEENLEITLTIATKKEA